MTSWVRDRWKKLPSHESGWFSGSPPATAASIAMTPMIVASLILPLRHTYIHRPMNMPMGIVAAMVKVPHAESASAFTTMMPRPAMAMTSTARMAIVPAGPAMPPISSLTRSAIDLAPRRVEAHRIIESCTAPARQTPATSHSRPGAQPNCAASIGPTSGPAPVIAAKWWPKSTHFDVG